MATLNSPSCPVCGAPTVLKTARRGPNAGKQFYGCSTWRPRNPNNCRGIVNLDEMSNGIDMTDQNVSSPAVSFEERTGADYPQVVMAAPTHPNLFTKFFQATAASGNIVNTSHDWELDRKLTRSFSQWRLDYPSSPAPNLGMQWLSILAVAESILTRGSLTLCSPGIEKEIFGIVDRDIIESQDIINALTTIVYQPTSEIDHRNLDSEEEIKFLESTTNYLRTLNSGWKISPQINLSSLTPNSEKQARLRCDFLFYDPMNEEPPFVVEIDGQQHIEHGASDSDREGVLSAVGIKTRRIPASDIRDSGGQQIDSLYEYLSRHSQTHQIDSLLEKPLRKSKFIHQIQLTVLEALRAGDIAPGNPTLIGIDIPDLIESQELIVELAVNAFKELVERLTKLLCQADVPDLNIKASVVRPGEKYDVIICPSASRANMSNSFPNAAIFSISDIVFPGEIATPVSPSSVLTINDPQEGDAKWFLDYLFRKPSFWPGQWETVERSLTQKDSVVLLPTGGGKSISFQLAALLLPGRCVVVAPLIALIDDQIDNLARNGIDRCVGITSQLSPQERESALNSFSMGRYLLTYVAPERFQIDSFRDSLRALTVSSPISLIAIDEAHCVSEWGHDFRTSYLNLGRISREYCESNGQTPPLIALTGTASKTVLKDVQRELNITDFDAIITPNSFDREELHFTVLHCNADEKVNRVQGFIGSLPSKFGMPANNFFQTGPTGKQCGIVFTPHTNGQFGVVETREALEDKIPTTIEIYSGSTVPRGKDEMGWSAERQEIAKRFKRDQTNLLVTTKAFGMGIDKPNVRYTVHLGLPESIESFYQEAGRAGRDGRHAECAIVVSNDYPDRTAEILSPNTEMTRIADISSDIDYGERDDISNAMFFHTQAFRGEKNEVTDLNAVLEDINTQSNLDREATLRITSNSNFGQYRNEQRSRTEKALHRLVILGVISDYTLDYANNEFTLRISGASQEEIITSYSKYAASYQGRLGLNARERTKHFIGRPHKEFVLLVASILIKFIYEHIELSRRRSLNEMLEAANNAGDGEALRSRILDYLQQSEYDESLEDVVNNSALGGLDAIGPIIDNIVSPNDAATLRGSVARLLASYPDLPGLLVLRSVSEALCRDVNEDLFIETMMAALDYAVDAYQLPDRIITESVIMAIQAISKNPNLVNRLIEQIPFWKSVNRDLLRAIIPIIPVDTAVSPAYVLLDTLIKNSSKMRTTTGAE